MRGQNQVLSSFYFELERVRAMARKKNIKLWATKNLEKLARASRVRVLAVARCNPTISSTTSNCPSLQARLLFFFHKLTTQDRLQKTSEMVDTWFCRAQDKLPRIDTLYKLVQQNPDKLNPMLRRFHRTHIFGRNNIHLFRLCRKFQFHMDQHLNKGKKFNFQKREKVV